MHISARVVPATAAWTGLNEAGTAARRVARDYAGRPLVRRTGVVQTRGEVIRVDGRSLLLVTVQHPQN